MTGLTITKSLLLSFLILVIDSKAQEIIDIDQLSDSLDKAIPKIMDQYHVPGAAIALLHEENVVYQKCFGYSDLNGKVPITNLTGFNIGSISKTFTAWGIMKLMEQDKIELDNPANKYLTRWHFPKSTYDEKEVTIRRILSHTAGLNVHGYNGWRNASKLPTLEGLLSGKPRKAYKVKIVYEPGSGFKYSGGGYTILQLVIEEITGDSFAHYMDTAILEPLGMNNSSFVIDDVILSQSSLEHNGKGKQIPFEYFTAQAAAGLHTNLDDFARFVRANISTRNHKDPKTYIMSNSSIQEMMTVATATEKAEGYGLGYNRLYHHNNNKVWGHGGANSGWRAIFAINTDLNTALIIMTNSFSGREVVNAVYGLWRKWQSE